MGGKSKIEWTDATWNPLRGCSRVSEGCRNCYAEAVAARFSKPGQAYEGLAVMKEGGPHWTGKVRLVEEALELPLRWKKPRRIFVNSMSDLFHESVPQEWIARIFLAMFNAPQHVYQVLTKRAERMRDVMKDFTQHSTIFAGKPLPNVWLVVSVEDQATADERIPLLLQTPAAVRGVSYEPALGPVNFLAESWLLNRYVHGPTKPDGEIGDVLEHRPRVDWVVVGGESGPRARPFDVEWARRTISQCKAADVPCFVKQLGSYPIIDCRYDRTISGSTRKLRDRKGGDMAEWPEDLRVREYPTVASQ